MDADKPNTPQVNADWRTVNRANWDERVPIHVAGVSTKGGVGLVVTVLPPPVWVVVTSYRVLMFARNGSSAKPGKLVFEAPRQALTAEVRLRVLFQVIVADRNDGQSLVRLNFGVRKRSAKKIVAGIEPGDALAASGGAS